MEKVSDFFSELKERLSNPFILSYLAAWCIWNHEIIVVLIFYKASELKSIGFKSFLDVIHHYSSTWNFLWKPLLSALGYTLLFPLVKNLILAYGAFSDRWGTNWNMKISKTRTVAVERLLEDKKKYEDALQKIIDYANEKDKLDERLANEIDRNFSLTAKLREEQSLYTGSINEKEAELENYSDQIKSWVTANSIDFFDGEWYLWTYKIVGLTGHKTGVNKYRVVCKFNEMTLYTESSESKKLFVSCILSNFQRMVVYFTESHKEQVFTDIYWQLNKLDDFSSFKGNDSHGLTIEIKRKTDIPTIEN